MKNYKKIFNRLIKEIKKEVNLISKNNTHRTSNLGLLEAIENNAQVDTFNWILTLLPELEGKECQMILMNRKEFKKWKEMIK